MNNKRIWENISGGGSVVVDLEGEDEERDRKQDALTPWYATFVMINLTKMLRSRLGDHNISHQNVLPKVATSILYPLYSPAPPYLNSGSSAVLLFVTDHVNILLLQGKVMSSVVSVLLLMGGGGGGWSDKLLIHPS